MSGYFGALMRSSGMPVGDRPPATSAAAPPGLEVNVEHVPAAIPMTPPPIAPAQKPSAPVASLDPPPATVHPGRPTAVDHVGEAHEAPVAAPRRTRETNETSSDEPGRAAPVVDQPKPDRGQALIKAAMRWVAADPPTLPRPAQTVTPLETRSAMGDRARVDAIDQPVAPPEFAATIDTASTNTTPEPALPKVIEARAPVEVGPVPIRRTPPVPPPASTPPLVRDELVEVSIGAIHVRVDAPAAQTVARPAASPAPVTRRATSAKARSALSRRALRRI
jgi:hypothetical protein